MHSQITLTEERSPLQNNHQVIRKAEVCEVNEFASRVKFPKVPTMLFKLLDKYSIPITNNNGERGSPCRNPHFAAKMLVGDSLIIKT